MNSYFVAIDGDDVGRKLEYYMLINDTASLRSFSQSFERAIIWLRDRLANTYNGDIVFWGGDNMLAFVALAEGSINQIDKLRMEFREYTDSTVSIGIGITPQDAYLALKLAKASGKNQTYLFPAKTALNI